MTMALANNPDGNIVQYELTVKDVLTRRKKITDVMSEAMKEDVHFGRIPGTPKPTLLKPGAELINVMFCLGPEYEVMSENHKDDLISYNIRCNLLHIPTGNRVASGLGSCNSREKKYKKQCETGGAADLDNTILKMACKRALVAATLNATACSDTFSQDLEDMPTEMIQHKEATQTQQQANGPTTCPKCGAALSYRGEGKWGPWWSCSKYPNCDGKVSLKKWQQQQAQKARFSDHEPEPEPMQEEHQLGD